MPPLGARRIGAPGGPPEALSVPEREQNPLTSSRAAGLLVLGAFGISFSPVFVKMLGMGILGPTAIGFWRTIIGGVALALIALVSNKAKRLLLPLPVLAWCFLTGFVFFLDLSIWHRAIIYVGSGMSTVLGNTQVFASSILCYFIFKEKLTLRFFGAAAAGLCGVSLLVGLLSAEVAFTPEYVRGIVYGLLTGLMYALYMVGIKKASSHRSTPDPLAIITWICLSSALFLGLGSMAEEGAFMPPDLRAVAVLLGLGVVVQALTWWLITFAMRGIPVHHASLILLLQPVLAILWGYLFFNEVLASLQVVGAFITIFAVYFGAIQKRKAPIKNREFVKRG